MNTDYLFSGMDSRTFDSTVVVVDSFVKHADRKKNILGTLHFQDYSTPMNFKISIPTDVLIPMHWEFFFPILEITNIFS